MRWAGQVARMGRSTYRILAGKPEKKGLPGRPILRKWIILKLILER
jgi:hypothetical protein